MKCQGLVKSIMGIVVGVSLAAVGLTSGGALAQEKSGTIGVSMPNIKGHRAVQGANRCGKVKVLFAVLGEQAEEMMRAGCADYVVAQQPVLIGRLGVRMANELIRGQTSQEKSIEVPLF